MQPNTTQNVNAALPAALDSLSIGDTTGHTKRKTTTGELPNELWDIIIGQYFRDSESILTQRHRIACSLVCREWRSIALSHLFRRIRIPTPKRDVAAYRTFLCERPWIAKVVKYIHIGYIEIDIIDLGDILEALLNLETLDIRPARLEDRGDSQSRRALWAHRIPRLMYYNSKHDVEVAYNELMRLLSLFSEIKHLGLTLDSSRQVVPSDFIASAVKQTAPGRLIIHSLVQPRDRAPMDSFVPTFLNSIGALQQLTRLDFELEDSNESVARFGKVLVSVGRGLKRLGIIVRRVLVPGHLEINENLLADGLRACSGLEVLTLEVDPGVHSDSMQGVEARNDEWIAAVRLMSLIPGGHIHSVTLDIKFFARLNACLLIHLWPWYSMREALLRFDNLRSLVVNVEINSSAFYQHQECVEYEMRESRDILGTNWPNKWSDSTCTCSNPACRKYNSEKSSANILGRV